MFFSLRSYLSTSLLLAAVLPVMIAFSQLPLHSFYNMAVALLGWSAVLLGVGHALGGLRGRESLRAGALMAVLLGIALWASEGTRVLVLVFTCLLLGAGLAARPTLLQPSVTGLFMGYALAALAALIVCCFQFFAPELADNIWIAGSPTAGRAVGNLRQPNLQATMLIWGAIAAAWLAANHKFWRRVFPMLLTALMFAVALTGSRTGMALTALLMLWGGLDRLLPAQVRVGLVVAPLLLGLSVLALAGWAHGMGESYFVEARARADGDISSSRFAIWSNIIDLIIAEPWVGVGWGNLNFAWTLTPFPQRPISFFDHAHNLPLQLAVELGIPAALLICSAFAFLMWRARGALTLPDKGQASVGRAVFVMILAVMIHSLLEYPLWYPFFLLPSAFLCGLYLRMGWPRSCVAGGWDMNFLRHPGMIGTVLLTAGSVLLAGTLYAIWDYQRIVQIFEPHGVAGTRPLQERIRNGLQSWFFGAHADYAMVTNSSRPSEVYPFFQRPLRYLVDARLMVAYAKALNERGERDKAIYVAQRLREFRHPIGDVFFAPCSAPHPIDKALLFQCETTPVMLTYRDFK